MAVQKKYEQVLESMRRDLKEWNLQPEDEFLTDKEAMERYGVSRITIRRAFAELEEDGLIIRIRGRGTLLNPNPVHKVRMIAYLGFSIANSGIEPLLIKGMEDHLLAHHSNLIICNLENDPDRARQYVDRLQRTDLDGIIFTPMLGPAQHNHSIVDFMKKRGIPFVVVDRSVPGMEDDLVEITADNFDGGYQLTQHLLSLGHQRIAFFRSLDLEWCTALTGRRLGYLHALREAGIEPDPDLEGYAPYNSMLLQLRRWMSMSDPPTAVFIDNDLDLAKFYEIATSQNIRIPEDLSIAGFDDMPQLSMPIAHTTIHAPHFEVGQTAAMQLLNLIEGKPITSRHTVLPVTLKIRKTTGINPRFKLQAAKNHA